MLQTKTAIAYRAFGLTIGSDIALPELTPEERLDQPIDLSIKLDPFLKNGYSGKPFQFAVDGCRTTILIPAVGVFRIQNGNEIIVSPFASADEDIIRLYVLGSCMGALLLQKQQFPLHGSAIAINGRAYAFVGNSGAGKSTLASAFMERGYPMLSDDVIALSETSGEMPIVMPSYPQQKLWQQSLDAFGMDHAGFSSIYGRETKFCVPVQQLFYPHSLPLAAVIELVKSDSAAGDIGIRRVSLKLEQLHKLNEHTYRQYLIPKMNLTNWHFHQSTAIAAAVPVYQMSRSGPGFTAHELVDLVLSTIAKEE